MRICAPPPGSPLFVVICTPATRPCEHLGRVGRRRPCWPRSASTVRDRAGDRLASLRAVAGDDDFTQTSPRRRLSRSRRSRFRRPSRLTGASVSGESDAAGLNALWPVGDAVQEIAAVSRVRPPICVPTTCTCAFGNWLLRSWSPTTRPETLPVPCAPTGCQRGADQRAADDPTFLRHTHPSRLRSADGAAAPWRRTEVARVSAMHVLYGFTTVNGIEFHNRAQPAGFA